MTEHEPGLLEDWDREDWGHKDCDVCTDARRDRLTVAQEGVVKALDNLTRLNFDSVVEVGWDPEDPRFTKCYLDLRDAACAALKELEEASK